MGKLAFTRVWSEVFVGLFGNFIYKPHFRENYVVYLLVQDELIMNSLIFCPICCYLCVVDHSFPANNCLIIIFVPFWSFIITEIWSIVCVFRIKISNYLKGWHIDINKACFQLTFWLRSLGYDCCHYALYLLISRSLFHNNAVTPYPLFALWSVMGSLSDLLWDHHHQQNWSTM